MTFQDLTAAIGAEFGIEIETVNETCAFAVAGGEGSTVVEVMIQGVSERDMVLFSADLGETPPESDARFYRTLLGANHLFARTAGATLSLDTAANRVRLQKYEHPDELANDIRATVTSFLETALNWARTIADYRASEGSALEEPHLGEGTSPMDTFNFIRV